MTAFRISLAALACSPVAALGQGRFAGLGLLPTGSWSMARAISADGSCVVGAASPDGSNNHNAFRWTWAGGMENLGSLRISPFAQADAYSCSGDGSAIFGWTEVDSEFGNRAAWWSVNQGWTEMTPHTDDSGAGFVWVSSDAQVGLGTALRPIQNGAVRTAFLWRRNLGWEFVAPLYPVAAATSDGSTVLGTIDVSSVLRFADGTIQPLTALPGQINAIGNAMTPTGQIIVGTSGPRACRWTPAGVEALPSIYGPSSHKALAVSADGITIVGSAGYGGGVLNAVVWRHDIGVFEVRESLEHSGINLSGWWLQEAVAVSSDGRTIAGNGRHWLDPQSQVYRQEGWVAYLPQGFGCYANCDQSTTPPYLGVSDFACFLNLFAAGDPHANCDGSTAAPTLNVLDFICFLNRFVAGCP